MTAWFLIPAVLAWLGPAMAPESPEGVVATITTIDGRSIEARVLAIDERTGLRYEATSGRSTLPLADLERLVPQDATPMRALPNACRFYLNDGGEWSGVLLTSDDSRLLRVQSQLNRPIELPLDALAAVRFPGVDDVAANSELSARLADRPAGKDLLLVIREGKTVVLPGVLESLTADRWQFRLGGTVQDSPLSEAYGMVLAKPATRAKRPRGFIRFPGGERLGLASITADGSTLRVLSALIGPLDVPWDRAASIELTSERVVYLSDLSPEETKQRSFLDANWKVQRDRNVTGGPLRLGGRSYAKGLGVRSYTALRYKLDGGYEQFLAVAGLDDSVGGRGHVVFRVRGDDRVLFDSSQPEGQTRGPFPIRLDVRGVKTLTLECDFGEGLDVSDHADWADARLIRSRTDDPR